MECERWAGKFAQEYAPTTYNHSLALVKHAFDQAVEAGVRYDNPAKSLKRQTERPKKLTLPTYAQFAAFVNEIEHGGSGKSKPCATLVRFHKLTLTTLIGGYLDAFDPDYVVTVGKLIIRREIYDLVWQRPISKLAALWGCSTN